ncbi:HK97 gp10 family phage protein [Rhodococcus sp. B10]|uniref:HK97 gp10 family phage protein n=1 Tax=Rhodococcus sp. B10 TaxID=2695876 RepID=UPI00142F9D28|nr:HK97 gp10 family phage protein [Rhodococcus sp. B10]NIL77605.1 hypothetical protein [Rhodococcus sp. B10]
MVARVRVFRRQSEREAREASTPKREEIAIQIAQEFRGTAPRRSGQFANNSHVVVEGDRVFAVNDDPLGFYKEYGTSKSRGAASLTNAARKHGKYTGFQPRGAGGRRARRRS